MSLLDKIKNDIVESHVWKSIFRHGYEDTPRNRVMMVTANVFLHLHPAKVRRHAVRPIAARELEGGVVEGVEAGERDELKLVAHGPQLPLEPSPTCRQAWLREASGSSTRTALLSPRPMVSAPDAGRSYVA